MTDNCSMTASRKTTG